MRLDKMYLSDDELEKLIADIEQNEMVEAPPDLEENIIAVIEKQQYKNRVKEYRAYKLRVIASVAAAIVMVFIQPYFFNEDNQDLNINRREVSFNIFKPEYKIFNDARNINDSFNDTKIIDDKFNLLDELEELL